MTQCDEFPYLATQQGGQANGASLRPISKTSNETQGGRYGNFVTYCNLVGPPDLDPGSSFAVVPIPAIASGVLPVPTVGLCAPGDRP